jgi:PIN domain
VAGYVVVLDANVLYGIDVTDLMVTMATRRLFRPHWSLQILDEVARNLAKRSDLNEASIGRRIEHMNRALPDALKDAPDELIDAMPVNEKDRHVLALAVHVGAPTIVTDNLKDFPPELCEPFDVEAISADAFTLAQVHLHRADVLASIDAMAARRQRHPKTRADIIGRLRTLLPTAMAELD